HKIVKDAPFISTIGVALAMISETIERSVVNPTEADIKKIRMDIIDKMLEMGALLETIEVSIEVDSLNHVLRAFASGTNEIKKQEASMDALDESTLKEIAIRSVGFDEATAEIVASNDNVVNIEVTKKSKKLFGLLKQETNASVILSHEGVVKIRRLQGEIIYGSAGNVESMLETILDQYSNYSDAGQTVPEILAYVRYRSFNYSGLMNKDQILEIAKLDFEGVNEDERIVFMVTRRG
ncbi:MAG TPA: hypothetical protein VKY25_01300, partial [Erysipelothrix sp.]|nr:hypothetical protein [Erysipelothrix sp.]